MSEYKVGDKVILHRDRIPKYKKAILEKLMASKGETWDSIESTVLDTSLIHAVLGFSDGSQIRVPEDWVTKVEEPKEPEYENDFKVGDRVVIHKPKDTNKHPTWNEDMDYLDGKSVTIGEIKTLDFGKYFRFDDWSIPLAWCTASEEDHIEGISVPEPDKQQEAYFRDDGFTLNYHAGLGELLYVITDTEEGIKISRADKEPNKEMIEADNQSPFNGELKWKGEVESFDKDGFTVKCFGGEGDVHHITESLTPMDAIEKIGRALTKTAGFPKKLGCYEHVKGNLDAD